MIRATFDRYGAYCVLALIVCIAFGVRFAAFDHPLGLHGGEGFRDYLTARHIVEFRELPAAGPWNQTLPHLGNSPLYYYLLSLPLFFVSSWSALEIAYIALTCIGIVLLFLLAREVFDVRTALLSAAIYAVAPEMIKESATFVWQPFVMEPLLIAAALSGFLGYRRGVLHLMLLAIVLLIAALSLHLAVLGVLIPLALLLALAIYARNGIRGIVFAGMTACISVLVVFVIPRLLARPIFAGVQTPVPERGHLLEFFKLLLFRISPLEAPPLVPALLFSMAVLIVGTTALYLFATHDRFKKYALLVGLGVVTLQCVIAAGYGTQVDTRFVLPATFALVIALSALIQFLIAQVPFARIVSLIPIVVVIGVALSSPFIAAALHKPSILSRPHQALADRAADILASDLELIRAHEGYGDYGFFSIQGVRTNGYVIVPDMMWSALEDRFNTQLVHVSGDSGGLIGPSATPYIVLLCADGDRGAAHYPASECLKHSPEGYAPVKQEFLDPALNVYLLRETSRPAVPPSD